MPAEYAYSLYYTNTRILLIMFFKPTTVHASILVFIFFLQHFSGVASTISTVKKWKSYWLFLCRFCCLCETNWRCCCLSVCCTIFLSAMYRFSSLLSSTILFLWLSHFYIDFWCDFLFECSAQFSLIFFSIDATQTTLSNCVHIIHSKRSCGYGLYWLWAWYSCACACVCLPMATGRAPKNVYEKNLEYSFIHEWKIDEIFMIDISDIHGKRENPLQHLCGNMKSF